MTLFRGQYPSLPTKAPLTLLVAIDEQSTLQSLVAYFPTDEAMLKMLYLALPQIGKNWTMPIRD